MINVWLWVRWYTKKNSEEGSTNETPVRTHTRPLTGQTRPDWDFLPTARERDFTDLKEKKGGQKKLDTMGKYATFQTKYWQNVGRKISQWYKEHFQRKVFIERLRRVDQTLLIKGHCTETIIMCWTLTTNINAYVKDRGFLIRLKEQQPFKKKEKQKVGNYEVV